MRTLNISNNNNSASSSFEPSRQSTTSIAERNALRQTASIPPSNLKAGRKPRPPPLKPSTRTATITTTTTTTATRTALTATGPTTTTTRRTPTSSTALKTPPASARLRRTPVTPGASSVSAATSPSPRSTLGQNKVRTQHVLALRATRSPVTTSASPKMAPGDSSSSSSSTRPRQPQLSVGAAKSVGRTPLTPKIATKAVAPASAPAPLSRRSTYNSTSNRDDGNAPFLTASASATPRSRTTRGDSNNTTPIGTPTLDRPFDKRDKSQRSSTKASRLSQGDLGDAESKFFYASDARSLQPSSQPQRPLSVPQKPATFFYASEKTSLEAKRTASPPVGGSLTPSIASTTEASPSKFFYANGAPDLASKPAAPSPTSSTASRTPLPGRPSSGSSTVSYSQRPMSPSKTSQSAQPALKGSALPPGPLSRASVASPPSLTRTKSQRRVSIEVPPKIKKSHARTGSVPSIDSIMTPRMPCSPMPTISAPASPPQSPGLVQPAMTMASILQAAEEMIDDDDEDEGSDSGSGSDSDSDNQRPAKSRSRDNDKDKERGPVSDLVANARRERKVQDLQITNASLEAINRTLERQLRKQTNELRRFRRLTRAGALSVSSPGENSMPSETLAEPTIDLSDLSEDERDSTHEDQQDEPVAATKEHDPLEDSDAESDADEADSISSNDPEFATRQKRDERRLQLDVAKHRELMVDSQKINQSIKRCLNWTEILIKEGQKALDYKVTVSDVKIGGRVLAPPDDDVDEDDVSVSQMGDDTLKLIERGLEQPWDKESQDRDSGIELSAEGLKAVVSDQ